MVVAGVCFCLCGGKENVLSEGYKDGEGNGWRNGGRDKGKKKHVLMWFHSKMRCILVILRYFVLCGRGLQGLFVEVKHL